MTYSILALQQAPGLSENDAVSIDHLPGLKSLKMQVCHWGTAPNTDRIHCRIGEPYLKTLLLVKPSIRNLTYCIFFVEYHGHILV